MMLGVYRDAKLACEQVEWLAGGSVRCANQLETINLVPGLSEFVDARIDQLAERVRMIHPIVPG